MKQFVGLTTLTSAFARVKPAFMTIVTPLPSQNPSAVSRLKQIMSEREE